MVLLLRRADLKLEDAFGLGILQRARQVVREEELAALEELRNALGGGVLTPAASISTAFRGLRSCFGLSFMAFQSHRCRFMGLGSHAERKSSFESPRFGAMRCISRRVRGLRYLETASTVGDSGGFQGVVKVDGPPNAWKSMEISGFSYETP